MPNKVSLRRDAAFALSSTITRSITASGMVMVKAARLPCMASMVLVLHTVAAKPSPCKQYT